MVESVSGIVPVKKNNSINSNNNKTGIFQKQDEKPDVIDITPKKSQISVEQKKAILKSAIKNSAGWAIVGHGFSSLYYAFRSDKTIADKYGLDVNADKDFIAKIRTKQTLWTIPGLLPLAGSIAGFLIASGVKYEDYEVM